MDGWTKTVEVIVFVWSLYWTYSRIRLATNANARNRLALMLRELDEEVKNKLS